MTKAAQLKMEWLNGQLAAQEKLPKYQEPLLLLVGQIYAERDALLALAKNHLYKPKPKPVPVVETKATTEEKPPAADGGETKEGADAEPAAAKEGDAAMDLD